MSDPPTECPECGGPLARGGVALSCKECDWRSSLEQTAEWVDGIDDEDDDE